MPSLTRSKSETKALIERAQEEGQALLDQAQQIEQAIGLTPEVLQKWTQERERWDARSKAALEACVSDDGWPVEFERAATGSIFRVVNQTPWDTFMNGREAVSRGINTLESIKERLEFSQEPSGAQNADPPPTGNDVFVVHGHDDGLKNEVARVLTNLGLNPIILDEQPGRSRTLIEKFEDHSVQVGFAVVIMTPDDVGFAAGTNKPSAANRARQNVILELGYFIGKLGRNRVAALKARDVDPPSDIHGVSYLPTDGGWQLSLAKELKAAGIDVDLNNL